MTDTQKIRMTQYTNKQTKDILQRRINKALKKDTIKQKALDLIAESSEGDARQAILTLKQAAQNAENQKQEKITEKHVQKAVNNAKTQKHQKNSKKLGKHQKKLKKILEQTDKPQKMDEIHQKYKQNDEIDEPKSKRTLRRYLNKMESYNFIQIEGQSTNRTYKII
jgi:Cdc6-like AAA superfamily ATPase